MVCFCVFGALAGEVTFDASVDKGQWTGDDDAAAESITKDGVGRPFNTFKVSFDMK